MKENIDKFLEFLKEQTNNYDNLGIIFLIGDIVLTFLIIFFLFKLLKIKVKSKKVLIFLGIVILLFSFTFFLGFNIAYKFLQSLAFWSVGVLVILYTQEIKHTLDISIHTNNNDNGFNSEEEKMQVVNMLVNSAQYLSERRIGALICIERTDSLDSLIDKAIYIKGNITEELLTSLFFVGSATHDGAVIIRNKYIMCAGAILPSTDKYDVPKTLGTRHRAAIGVSEKFDSVTIVVSEETGKVSVTVDGTIKLDLAKDRLTELLSQSLYTK